MGNDVEALSGGGCGIVMAFGNTGQGTDKFRELEGEVEMPDRTLDWKDGEDTGGKFYESFIICVMRKMGSKEMISG